MKEQLIPWSSRGSWLEANNCIKHLCAVHKHRLHEVRACARQIQENLELLFSQMDALCSTTCVSCRETCCSVAKLWYDHKDLIFLHISETQIPDTQPLHNYKDTCRYLGQIGCTLPRMGRPWICTHYICHTQTAYLRKHNRNLLGKMEICLAEIKQLRNDMEDVFIRITVWGR